MKKSMMLAIMFAAFTAACSSSSSNKEECRRGRMKHLTEAQRECVKKYKRANCPREDIERDEVRREAKECRRAAFVACHVEMPEHSEKTERR